MDQTLIESVNEGDGERWLESQGTLLTYYHNTIINQIKVALPNKVKVAIRPNAIEMVRSIVNHGHTYILWSAGIYEYVHAVMQYFIQASGVAPTVIYTREDMVIEEGIRYKSMTSKGYTLDSFLILEDNPGLVLPAERSRIIKVIPWVFESEADSEMTWVSQLFRMYSESSKLQQSRRNGIRLISA